MTELNQPPQLALQAARKSERASLLRELRKAFIAKLKARLAAHPESSLTSKEALALFDQAAKEVAR